MLFSRETLESTLNNLTADVAMRMIALAGGKHELTDLVSRLARNFGAVVPQTALLTIAVASQRWHTAQGSRAINYSAK